MFAKTLRNTGKQLRIENNQTISSIKTVFSPFFYAKTFLKDWPNLIPILVLAQKYTLVLVLNFNIDNQSFTFFSVKLTQINLVSKMIFF